MNNKRLEEICNKYNADSLIDSILKDHKLISMSSTMRIPTNETLAFITYFTLNSEKNEMKPPISMLLKDFGLSSKIIRYPLNKLNKIKKILNYNIMPKTLSDLLNLYYPLLFKEDFIIKKKDLLTMLYELAKPNQNNTHFICLFLKAIGDNNQAIITWDLFTEITNIKYSRKMMDIYDRINIKLG